MDGTQIKQWREARDLSINALAAKLGVRASTVMRWEKGMRPDSTVMVERALRDLEREIEGASHAG